MANEKYLLESCDLTYAVCKIGGRWKLLILCKLEDGKMRFSTLRDSITGITERMLTKQLREMEKDGLISRTVHAEVPPRVEYAMTNIAKELVPIWSELSKWGGKHRMVIATVDE